MVDKFLRIKEESYIDRDKVIVDHARLRALMARLRYQRERFEKYLMVQKHVSFDITEKMPYELKIQKLPVSFHYYDAVPILMAKYIGT